MQAVKAAYALAALIVLSNRLAEGADGDETENAAEFRTLCGLAKMLAKGMKEDGLAITQDITDVFSSLTRVHNLAGNNKTAIEQAASKEENSLKNGDKPLPSTPAGIEAAEAINRTFEIAKTAIDARRQKVTAAKDKAKKANEFMKAALYGSKDIQLPLKPGSAIFTATNKEVIFGSGGNYKVCGGTGFTKASNDNLGRSLTAALVCLCIEGASGKKLCSTAATTTGKNDGHFGASISDLATPWDTLLTHCDVPEMAPTAARLTAAIAQVTALIGANAKSADTDASGKREFVLGYINNVDTGCTGVDKQTCVNYGALLQGGSPHGIPWLRNIQEAISALSHEPSADDDVTLKMQLETANATAWTAYAAGFKPDPTVSRPDSAPTNHQEAAKTDCSKEQNSSTCKPPCKWNENATDKTKKCSLDPKKAAEQATQAAGTGDGAAGAAATGCAQHFNDKDKCEKMNEGKDKPICGWGKRKDGEEAPENAEIVFFSSIRNLF
uniref:Variant surface glycoprotein 1125.1050 n=1 Tax=Trypanosoma brucei TaxID=5691 RepID=A0A1J0R4D8_9TRYP|nr:variant surface glycoprotein 1125.1050 [Trypanosoma brucei]